MPSRATRARTIGLLMLAVAVAPSRLYARQPGSGGALTGTVFDGSRAVVPDAHITISGPSLIGGPRALTTDARGRYRFTLVPPGRYDVVVECRGFRAVQRGGVRVPAGATLTIDVTLEVAGIDTILEVVGPSPMVDVTSPAAPTRLEQDLLFNVPASRALSGIVNLVPGVAADVALGGSQKSNEILLDGVRLTDPLFQDPLMRVNYNWVQEVQVVSLGASAEHGGFTGVAAGAVLRSGSNRFAGLGEFWTTRPGWLGRNTTGLSADLGHEFEPRRIVEWWDSSAQAGGPIAEDHLWFFSGLQYARHDDRPAGYTGPGSRDERDVQAIVKLNAALSPIFRIDGFINRGRLDVAGEYLGALTPLEAASATIQPQTSWNARATWAISPRTLLDIRHGGYDSTRAEDPMPPNTREGPPGHWDYGTGRSSVNANYFWGQDASDSVTSATLTHHAQRFAGRHEFKFGVEYERTSARQEWGYPGGRYYIDYYGAPYAVVSSGGNSAAATTGRTTVYAQDDWEMPGRLTLSPGLRFDRNRGTTPAKDELFETNPVSPRIGVAWDVTPDHRTVLRAHFGRYHDTIFSSRIMFGDRSDRSPYTYSLIVGDHLIDLIRNNNEIDDYAIDPDIRHSHVDQWVAGLEHELFTDFSATVQYIRRRFDTFMGLIDTGSVYQPVERRDPGPDGRLGTADDGALITVFNLTNPGKSFNVYTNPENAFNRYDAVQVVGRKRSSRNWQMQASYTWSKNRGTVGNRWHVNAARFDLGRPGRFVNPNSFINAYGRAPFDPTHEVKLMGTYRVPAWGGFNASAVYRYTTGQAWGRRARITGFNQGGEVVLMEPWGTRRLPAINRVDLRLEKTLDIPRAAGRLGLFFDIFNLTNQGVPNSDATTAVNEFSGPTFGQPVAWTDPRQLRVGLRFSF